MRITCFFALSTLSRQAIQEAEENSYCTKSSGFAEFGLLNALLFCSNCQLV